MNHKIFTSLIKPPLPLGLTQGYIAFLLIIAGMFLPFILYVGIWVIGIVCALLLILFFFGKYKIKDDWQYFAVLWGVMKREKFNPRVYKNETYRK